MLSMGFKPWFRHTGKCGVSGCDSYKERRWLFNPVRFFCPHWFKRHVLPVLFPYWYVRGTIQDKAVERICGAMGVHPAVLGLGQAGDYRKARGAAPWHPPMLLPEDAIRRGRD